METYRIFFLSLKEWVQKVQETTLRKMHELHTFSNVFFYYLIKFIDSFDIKLLIRQKFHFYLNVSVRYTIISSAYFYLQLSSPRSNLLSSHNLPRKYPLNLKTNSPLLLFSLLPHLFQEYLSRGELGLNFNLCVSNLEMVESDSCEMAALKMHMHVSILHVEQAKLKNYKSYYSSIIYIRI